MLAFGQTGAPVFPQQLSSFPAGLYVNISTIDPNIANSYSHQASLQIERQAGRSTFSAGYQWTRALHLILSRNVNVPTLTAAQASSLGVPNLGRPDSRFGNMSRYEGSGDSYYNGFLASWKTSLSKASEVRISYNLSKTIDDVGNFFFSGPQNNFDLRDDRGLSDNDQRHRVSASGRFAFRGFELSSLLMYTSSLPYNVQVNFDRNNDTSVNDRPAGVGRNTGRGFDFFSLDARLSRAFRLGDTCRINTFLESFNSLNRANWSVPNNIAGLPTFGKATAAYDPRQIQLGLKMTF